MSAASALPMDSPNTHSNNAALAGWQQVEKSDIYSLSKDDAPCHDIHLEIQRLQQSLAILYEKASRMDSKEVSSSRRSESDGSIYSNRGESPSPSVQSVGIHLSNCRSPLGSVSNDDRLSTIRTDLPLLSPLLSSSSSTSLRSFNNRDSSLLTETPLSTPSSRSLAPLSRKPSSDLLTSLAVLKSSESLFTSYKEKMERDPNDVAKYEVEFRQCQLPDNDTSRAFVLDTLVQEYPILCEAPAKMFSPSGEPLPPTKKQEISDIERQARKNAIQIRFHGAASHSLLKTSVYLETRTVTWKRVGGLSTIQQRPPPANLDSTHLDPWMFDLKYGNNDAEMEAMAGKRIKKTYEINRSTRIGTCQHCHGGKVEKCRKCRGSAADECWWCKGSGKTGGDKCGRCNGEGLMVCQSCKGSTVVPCHPCHGEGKGVFAAFIQVSMIKVDLSVIPISSIIKQTEDLINDQEALRSACTKKAREMVDDLMTATSKQPTKERKKPRSFRPRRVICSLETSTSHLYELQVPREARLMASKKKSSTTPGLRPQSLFQRKIQISSFYFILPSDPTLCVAELSLADLKATVKGLNEKYQIQQYRKAIGDTSIPSSTSLPSMTPIQDTLLQRPNPLSQLNLSSLSANTSSSSLAIPTHSPSH